MSKAKRNDRERYQPPTPPRWKGRDSLDLAYQLNQRVFRLVSDLAANANVDGWPLITHDRELWSKLDAPAIARAARFPFVILDVHFTSEKWWRHVIDGRISAEDAPWPNSVSEQLMNETLIFAWHTAKWDWRVARLSLGMLRTVAELTATLTPQQLASVSAQHRGALRLRWQDDSDFWTRLLVAAIDGGEDALADIHLHANLLLSGELIAG